MRRQKHIKMKSYKLFGLLLLACLPLFAQGSENDSLKILWIGNSYTYYNNLPAMVTKLAAEQGVKLSPTRFLKGGAHLAGHYKNEKLIEALKKGGWDYIVMQEHSSAPAQSTRDVIAETYYYAHLLDSIAMKGSPKAHVIFYMTWGHKNGNMQNHKHPDPAYPLDETYEDFQTRLKTTYLELTYENHAWCSPVGMAWQQVRQKHPEIELYTKDCSHPSKEGSYLAAHCFLSTILQRPYNSHLYFDIPENQAQALQMAAQNAVFSNMRILGLSK